tara:strand:- start:1081 stop:1815 length:735 start_codon:yes stop_codon:yes gene_type:complete
MSLIQSTSTHNVLYKEKPRYQQYPDYQHIQSVQTDTYADKKEITITKKIPKATIGRRQRMKFFGDANEISNIGLTTIGREVHIEYINEKPRIEKKKPLTTFASKGCFGTYKPNMDRCKNIDMDSFSSAPSANGFVRSGYVPTHIQEQIVSGKDVEEFSIMLKNFPTHMGMDALKDMFRKHFKSYGDIQRITILRNNDNTIKDIAFIEYYYNKDALKVFEEPKRLIIGRQIVSIQKKKKTKKKFI